MGGRKEGGIACLTELLSGFNEMTHVHLLAQHLVKKLGTKLVRDHSFSLYFLLNLTKTGISDIRTSN